MKKCYLSLGVVLSGVLLANSAQAAAGVTASTSNTQLHDNRRLQVSHQRWSTNQQIRKHVYADGTKTSEADNTNLDGSIVDQVDDTHGSIVTMPFTENSGYIRSPSGTGYARRNSIIKRSNNNVRKKYYDVLRAYDVFSQQANGVVLRQYRSRLDNLAGHKKIGLATESVLTSLSALGSNAGLKSGVKSATGSTLSTIIYEPSKITFAASVDGIGFTEIPPVWTLTGGPNHMSMMTLHGSGFTTGAGPSGSLVNSSTYAATSNIPIYTATDAASFGRLTQIAGPNTTTDVADHEITLNGAPIKLYKFVSTESATSSGVYALGVATHFTDLGAKVANAPIRFTAGSASVVTAGLTPTTKNGIKTYPAVFDISAASNMAMMSTSEGAFISSNSGQSWTSYSNRIPQIVQVAISEPVTGIPTNGTAATTLQLLLHADGTVKARGKYSSTAPGNKYIKVCAGRSWGMALNEDGKVYSIGLNEYGQLGTGSTVAQSTSFQTVSLNANIRDISCGSDHGVAMDINGNIYGWGSDAVSQLGSLNASSSGGTASNGSPLPAGKRLYSEWSSATAYTAGDIVLYEATMPSGGTTFSRWLAGSSAGTGNQPDDPTVNGTTNSMQYDIEHTYTQNNRVWWGQGNPGVAAGGTNGAPELEAPTTYLWFSALLTQTSACDPDGAANGASCPNRECRSDCEVNGNTPGCSSAPVAPCQCLNKGQSLSGENNHTKGEEHCGSMWWKVTNNRYWERMDDSWIANNKGKYGYAPESIVLIGNHYMRASSASPRLGITAAPSVSASGAVTDNASWFEVDYAAEERFIVRRPKLLSTSSTIAAESSGCARVFASGSTTYILK